jgi:hypothetical protein
MHHSTIPTASTPDKTHPNTPKTAVFTPNTIYPKRPFQINSPPLTIHFVVPNRIINPKGKFGKIPMAETLYFQNDPQWKDTKIGASQQMTIGLVGCLLTSLTMVVNQFGGNETPLTLNNKMVACDGYNDAWIKAAMVPAQFPKLGFKRQKWVDCRNQPAPMDLIDQGLAEGSVIIVQVDREQDRAFEDEDGHWVVLKEKQDNDYVIQDPWYTQGAPNTLVGRYGFGYKTPPEIIQQVIWHGKTDFPAKVEDKPTAPAPAAPTSAPVAPAPGAGPVAVRTTVDQLSFRNTPMQANNNIIRLFAQNELLLVEEKPQNIGQQGQWLKVKDQSGTVGYVAAWMVEKTAVPPQASRPPPPDAPAPQPPAPAPAPATPIIVRATTDLSYRSAPIVSADTYLGFFPANTLLKATQDAQNIGINGQWLQVATPDGRSVYVAAWLVVKA